MKLSFIYTLLLVLILLSCNKDEELEYGFVDGRLSPYFERFEQEASIRGVVTDLSPESIEAFIQNIFPGTVAGQCQRNDNRPSQIIIDETIWNESSDTEKEFLIFHELGHCILGRPHLDSAHTDGRCTSIMHSVSGVCRNEYESRRSEYLDELFQ